jgi:hypothetical protein
MSSVARYATKAVKIPAGRKAAAMPDQQFLTCLDYEPYAFQQSEIDALVSANFQQVSGSLYVAKTNAALDSVLSALNNLDTYWFESNEHSAVDLGKTIRIGVAGGDNDVITMRLVKRTGNIPSGGGPNHETASCYVVTGNKRGEQYNNALYASVLGTTPNNRSAKPFLNNGGYNPCIVSASVLETLFDSMVKVSGSLYLASSTTQFRSVLNALSNANNSESLTNDELSSIDLGKSVRVGIVGGENDLLVFRLVKRTGNVLGLGSPNNLPNVGYVLVASKVGQSSVDNAAEVQVTGSSPNALEVKPQNLLNGGYNPVLFPESVLQSVLADCVNVSGSLYLAKSSSQLASVCSSLNNPAGRDSLPNDSMSSVDMGKTIRLGLVGGESDLVTFASTRGVSNASNGDNLSTGYVVVASKLSQDYDTALKVAVLGSAPRDS